MLEEVLMIPGNSYTYTSGKGRNICSLPMGEALRTIIEKRSYRGCRKG